MAQTKAQLVDISTTGISAGSASTPGITFIGDLNTGIYSPGSDQVAISTSGAQRVTVDGSGRLLVGTSTSLNIDTFGSLSQIEGTSFTASQSIVRHGGAASIRLGSSGGSSIGSTTIVANGNELGYLLFAGADGTDFDSAAAKISCFVDGTPGANDMPGRLVFSTTADGASSPTERMRIDNAGSIGFNNTDFVINANAESRFVYNKGSGFTAVQNTSAIPFYVGRNTNDGTLIEFRQDNTAEGTISVSGTTVSYNGAHLSRWSQIPGIDPHDKDQRPEILRGTVMSNLDEMCDWIDLESGDAQDNEQLNKTKISDVEGDKNVAGIFQSWDDDDDTWVNDYYLAMTGDFIIRIAAGVIVERGDLLMSAGDGTAKPQDDDIIRSKTIAKVTSTNVSCTYEDGSYCVPCVLMAC